MLELAKGFKSILDACIPLKPGDRVLVVAYNEGRSMWEGEILMSVAASMGAETVLTILTPREIAGHEPPASVAAAMRHVDWVIQICEKASIVHTTARKEASAAGTKFAVMFDVPVDDVKKGVAAADIRLIRERTDNLSARLTKAKAARITTPSGTDLTLSLNGRQGFGISPLGPDLYHIPYYAEAGISPVEGTAEGTFVADLAMRGWGYLLREPLRCNVKEGRVVEILGSSADTDRLRKLAGADENASNIAEFGIGSSHIIPQEIQGTSRDFGRLGTVHIGIGRNNDIGGNTQSRIHQDGLLSRPTVELDRVCIMRDGVLLG